MTQTEKRIFLTKSLPAEQPKYRSMEIPSNITEQKLLLRSLMNIRYPPKISPDFLEVQDEYLQKETASKGIVDIADIF